VRSLSCHSVNGKVRLFITSPSLAENTDDSLCKFHESDLHLSHVNVKDVNVMLDSRLQVDVHFDDSSKKDT